MNQVHICEHNELLSTKFHAPACPSPLIPRPRLTALLDVGLTGPLTLVSAPAGCGKTTLLSSWVQSHAPWRCRESETPTKGPRRAGAGRRQGRRE